VILWIACGWVVLVAILTAQFPGLLIPVGLAFAANRAWPNDENVQEVEDPTRPDIVGLPID
jgi:hypothetical protein